MWGDVRTVFGDEPKGLPFVWQVAIGVCIGVLAANVITWMVVEARMRYELQEFTARTRAEAAKAQEDLAASQRQRRLADDRAAMERREAQLQHDRAVESAARQKLDAAVRKEEAWRRFYRPSPGCAEASTEVRCVNEHLKAKTVFEAKYGSGEL